MSKAFDQSDRSAKTDDDPDRHWVMDDLQETMEETQPQGRWVPRTTDHAQYGRLVAEANGALR
jgi:hypothetical protein